MIAYALHERRHVRRANPKDEEHADLKRWAPRGFDAEKFDAAAVNKKLATLSKRLARGRK